jgi:dTDP-4-dehydrorhamnose reductase
VVVAALPGHTFDGTDRRMRIVVCGRQGQLARALLEADRLPDMELVAIGRPALDMSDAASIASVIRREQPDLVINTAAYTFVDRAESEPDAAFAVNTTGADHVAQACAARSIPLIHISTDYVFAGSKLAPYVEDDPTFPATVYGRTKREGELRVMEACERHLILRTAWVHSPWGANFVKTMLRLANERSVIGVVDDQRGTPTYAPDLAAAVLAVARRAIADPDRISWGIYHAAGGGEATWCGFAREVFKAAAEQGLPAARVDPITTSDYPTPAPRPAYSRLSCDKLRREFGVELPHWQAGVRECVRRLALTLRETGA